MAGHRPKAPGWYPDPDIHPGSNRVLRYWSGRHWTDRRRPMPVLATLDIETIGGPLARETEGPARLVDLPILPLATASAEVMATREGSARSATSDVREVGLPTTGGGGRPPEPPRRDGGGGDGASGDGASGRRSPTLWRRKWWLLALLALIAAVGVALAGEAMRPSSPGRRVLTDATFVRLANGACATTLPGLRPPDGGQFPKAVTPAQAADAADKAAMGLDDLATKIGALPAATADQPHIAGWLDGWHRYAAIGHQYASDLRVHGASGQMPAFLDTAARLARSTDRFSRANGLTSCLFAFNYNPDPSTF